MVGARQTAALISDARWKSVEPLLREHSRRAAQWCVDHQMSDGRWSAAPDPRPFETALAGAALSLVDDPRARAAAARARQWISTHSSAASDDDTRAFDEALARLWMGEALDLRAPFW